MIKVLELVDVYLVPVSHSHGLKKANSRCGDSNFRSSRRCILSAMSARSSTPDASERTPLLSQQDEESLSVHNELPNGTAENDNDAASSIRSDTGKKRRRWPTIIALTALCTAVLLACIGFAAPSIAKEYAQEALVFEPTKVSVDSFTSFGVKARIQGVFYLDASRVKKKSVRDLGKAATWIAREVESGKSEVEVRLPQYKDALLGTAQIPPIKVNIRNKHYNHLDIHTELEPGDVELIRTLAKEFLDHRLEKINVAATAKVPINSGIFSLGTQIVQQTLHFGGSDIPTVPDIDIRKLRLAEYGPPGHPDGVKAKAIVSFLNEYPVNFDVPPLGFEVLLPDCFDDYLQLGIALTDLIHITPKEVINASVTGLIRQLPTSLTTACPGSNNSPLDTLVGDYLSGRDTTIYIKGGKQEPETPDWIGKLLRETTVPFSLPGHPFDNLIKKFSLADVHFSLPDPLADDGQPKVSAIVKVLVGLPDEMNINLDVDRVRADADVFYKGDRMGKLNLRKWQSANVTRVGEDLLIQSIVKNAPLEVTDDDVFSEVVQELIFGSKGVALDVKADVDANTQTALGEFVVRHIPAKGKIFVKPIARHGFQTPGISDMRILDSTPDGLVLQAQINVTNPTDYSAHVPYVNVSLVVNETQVGYAWATADVVPGRNNITVRASWENSDVGKNWLSQFISGYNTSLTVKTHQNSLPSLPNIGLNLTMAAPHMFSKFLQQATVR